MPGKYMERSIIEFQKSFRNDEDCAKHLAEQRWGNKFICPRCGHTEFWYISKRKLFECRKCDFQTSVTSGTIFHRTRVSLLKWYWLIYHMAMDKVGVSISEMQRILGIGQYRTAWLMAHKVRQAMAKRDERYGLAGLVEMDESFFGPAGTKRGRGSERKSTVLCAVSIYRNRKGEEKPGFAHMCVVEDASAETIENYLDRLGCGVKTKEGKQLMKAIRSDGWRSYGTATKNKELAHCKIILRDPKSAGRLLPWIHKLISNAKAVIRGPHRGVSEKHLQAYLSEITYRFNRRFWEKELFDRLIQACVSAEAITYKRLTKKYQPEPSA